MGSSRKVSMASAGSLTSSSESVGVDDAPTLRSCSPPLRQSGSLELYQQALLQHHLQQCSQTQPVYVAIKRVQLAMPPGSYSSENNTKGGAAGGGKPAPASPLRKRVSGMTSIVAPSGANDQAAALQLYTSEASSAINMREINTRLMPKEASKEILAMKLLNHPNIVRLYDVFLAGNDGKMYLVTEFVSGGNLASTMKDNKLPRSGVKREVFTRMMIVSITSALDYMHSQNLAHRDLKPANVLVGPPVKLCDLGFSNDGSQLVTRLGTAEYMAPEIVLADGRTPYNVKIDCWSLGVITYELISKHCDRPFVGRSYSALAQAILRNDVNYDLLSVGAYTVSSDCIDFIRCLLCESDKRMSAAEALMHPWLSERRLSVMSISDESAVTMENLSRSGDNVVSEGRGTSGSNSNGKSFGSRSKKNNKSGLRTITEE
jgi:serine/threonine protein kinase